jgi:hypothetical protein
MDTVLFTDHGIVVFAITASAMALIFSVLGLATTHQTRSDINHQLKGLLGVHGRLVFKWPNRSVFALTRLLISLGRHILSRQTFYVDGRFQSAYVYRCIRHKTRCRLCVGLGTELR